MQDRFKYRCFHKPTNKMFEFYSYDSNFVRATESLVVPSIKTFRLENCELIQCTGLKDKNGKLVYFDDLVRNKWGEICKVIMQTDERNYGRVVLQNVKYLNDEFNKDTCFIPGAIKDSEIIGNIYENPELLEVANG